MSMYTSTLTMPTRRAAAYIRVSPDYSEIQKKFFEEFAKGQGDTLVNIYCDEGKSALRISERTELTALLEAAKRHEFDVLYVKDACRLSRNVRDFVHIMSELKQCGVTVQFLDLGSF